MSQEEMVSRLACVLDEGALLRRDQAVLIGVSGGPDSVALLHLLQALNGRQDWSLSLQVAHLDHRLRGAEAEADAGFVESMCHELGLPCVVERIDVQKDADQQGISFEQAARQCRFDFFEKVCLHKNIEAVALAHHADDNAETVLHRMIRGTGLRGLGGMRIRRHLRPDSDIEVIRPLLSFTRSDIEQYLQENNIAYRVDRSNDSSAYTRNRIRHQLLPMLREQFNPQVADALNRLAEQARGVDEYLSDTSRRMLEAILIERREGVLVLHRPALARRSPVIRRQLIRQAIFLLGVPERELTYAHYNTLVDFAAGEEGSKSLDLPGGLRVVRRYDRLIFELADCDERPCLAGGQIPVSMQGRTVLPHCGSEIVAERLELSPEQIAEHIHQRRQSVEKILYEEWLDADSLHPPLIARTRRPGDRFFPLGMTGLKKISDFFIDEKIEAPLREKCVLLCDQLGPVWIVPLRIDHRVRLTRATRHVLRLKMVPTHS